MTTRAASAGLLLATALLFHAAGARADDAAAPPSLAPSQPESWYGYQTLLVDGIALVALPAGIALTVNEAKGDNAAIPGLAVTGLGATSYLFGAPIVHWAHGRVGIGFLSLGLRILAPVAGLGLGAVGSQITNDSKNQDGIPVGAGLGALAAIVIDAAVLSWEKPDADRASTTRPAQGLIPTFSVTKQALSVGVTSRF